MIDLLAIILYRLVGRWLPQSSSPGGKCSRRVRSWLATRLLAAKGKDVNIERGALFSGYKKVRLGDRSGIGINCRLYGPVTIGQCVMMGPEVLVYAIGHGTQSIDEPMIDQDAAPDRPVTIDDDVWIGTRAILLPGVRVGRGSIVGAGAVVSRDVAPYSVVVGNPARVVKSRGRLDP